MRVIDREYRNRSRKASFTVWFLGDFHIGASGTAEDAIKNDVRAIQEDDTAYWIGMGDYCDCIVHTDNKRFDARSLADWIPMKQLGELPQLQVERTANILAPISKKCIGLLTGNHEDELYKRHHVSIVHELAALMKRNGAAKSLPVCARCAWFSFKCYRDRKSKRLGSEYTLDIWAHHGWVAGRKPGGKANALYDKMGDIDCDVVALAHGHDKVTSRRDCLYRNAAGEVKAKQRVGFMTGGYLRNYVEEETGYSEEKGYDVARLGASRIHVEPFHQKIEVIS